MKEVYIRVQYFKNAPNNINVMYYKCQCETYGDIFEAIGVLSLAYVEDSTIVSIYYGYTLPWYVSPESVVEMPEKFFETKDLKL